jgi:hypothetical protein
MVANIAKCVEDVLNAVNSIRIQAFDDVLPILWQILWLFIVALLLVGGIVKQNHQGAEYLLEISGIGPDK